MKFHDHLELVAGSVIDENRQPAGDDQVTLGFLKGNILTVSELF
jgi:hypothetical protein